ncbi:helicase-related protein [Nocardia sp. NPDC127526]|uniref:helicase-related protein n=1 Tax=Nocardia sp. NPDC127526 TaxID=3345393 RepID=UPI003625A1AE
MNEAMRPELGEKYRFRAEMIEELTRDVFGPDATESEVLDEPPLSRYVVGVLWPSGEPLQEPPEPDEAESYDGDTFEDTPVAQSRMRYPSTMGLTLSVRLSQSRTISITPAGAHYVEVAEAGSAVGDGQWQRIPLELSTLEQDLTKPGIHADEVVPGLQVHRYVRPERDGIVTVSITLRNVQTTPRGTLRDSKAWFQVGLRVGTDRPAIVNRTFHRNTGHDEDLDSAALLYRNMYTFAVGHGCAATWDLSSAVNAMVTEVETTFLPTYEVSRARPGQLDESVDLRMSFLAEAGAAEVISNLRELTRRYRAWIDDLAATVENGAAGVLADLRSVAERHIRDARKAADRIDAGIRHLDNANAMQAFRLANRAMQLQRARQEWIRSGAAGQVGTGENERWYPFQIAYILLNLPALSDRKHPDRELADLLWFPTGGGKTEAYLGLVAYCIIHRRLHDPEAVGVAVIMRYTLRLLTIQQFERASMLMCSLETVRRSDIENLGRRPFSIGLWVGSGGTPNTLDEAKRAIRQLRSGREIGEQNPVQLTQCPWCGAALDANLYEVVLRPERHLRIACGRSGCDFAEGLPVHVVDEDIYNTRPELVLGTVDKFAQMAWKSDVGRLFARDGVGLPPDLIIQDELHLISGPLGSMVGLYETAIDAACSVKSLDDGSSYGRPKVIASTATIRRAEKQIEAVFARSAAQFPPPGIDPDQSFFAEPAPREALGTRAYVGIMAPGTSHATLLVRAYTAVLQAAADIAGDDATRDPYWTLLGYFNSLRVLGSANLQVEGDVRERLSLVANRKGTAARKLGSLNELTSRVPSADIPDRLKQLERRYADGSADDVVLATNMISVGVDIDRLGLMAVMGQPQSSAEYIQATSRVGRRHPGLVVVIFNSARSRDRSHYENFVPYHQALYRAVEATSATPFAARARDRGLHGVLVSLARLLVPALSGDSSAVLAEKHWDELREVAKLIEERVDRVAENEYDATSTELDRLLDVWVKDVAAKHNLRYSNRTNPEAALLVEAGTALVDESIEYSQDETPWPTLQSMRDVDAESTLYPIVMRRKS